MICTSIGCPHPFVYFSLYWQRHLRFLFPNTHSSFLVSVSLFMVYLTTLSVTRSMYPHMVVLMSGELEEIFFCGGSVVTKLEEFFFQYVL